MRKQIYLNVPKISVNQKKMYVAFDNPSVKYELQFVGNRNSDDELILNVKDAPAFDKDLNFKMSYKILGSKLAKNFSVNNMDFFFTYNKSTGYFDRSSLNIGEQADNEQIFDTSLKNFYIQLVDVLKNRFILGYLGANSKNENTNFYLREAHKYILRKKYELSIGQCLNFIKKIADKSYIPDEFVPGFISELQKTIYDGELSKGEWFKIETMAKLALLNEKKAKYSFDDVSLHKKALKEIREIHDARILNIQALKKNMENTK